MILGSVVVIPRPPRKKYAGALYHITSRGNGRAQIFYEDVNYPRENVSADRIDEVVAKEYGVKSEMLNADGHTTGVGLAKAVAMELACRLTGLRQRAIGARYGGVGSAAVIRSVEL